jgi:hypothetical protein
MSQKLFDLESLSQKSHQRDQDFNIISGYIYCVKAVFDKDLENIGVPNPDQLNRESG